MLPSSVDPDCVMVDDTTVTMFTGTVDGGFELLPGFEVQFTPHERLGALEM